jgi:HSP20 family protein
MFREEASMAESRRRRRSIFDLISDYMEDLEALSEDLFESEMTERPSWDLRSCCIEPLCNVSEAAGEVVVTADLPYTDPDTIKVEQIDGNTLEISADIKRKIDFNEFGVTHRQGEFQHFRCQVNIPVPVDVKRMKTKFKRGILTVHLPRKKGYRIKVE